MAIDIDPNHQEKILQQAGQRLRLRWLAPNALRVTHASGEAADFPPDRPWLADVLLPNTPPGDAPVELDGEFQAGCLRLLTAAGETLLAEARPPRQGMKRRRPYLSVDIPKTVVRLGLERVEAGVALALRLQPEEAFYGWGEWFDAFRRRSGGLRLRIRDAIALLQGHETYSAIPIFFSSRGYAFWLLNSHTSRWKIAPGTSAGADRLMEIEADGPGADYVVIYGPGFKRILETYTALSGRPPLLPRWAFGLWVTSYPQGDQEEVLAYVRQHRQRQIPLDAVILDYHWEEAFHNFRWRRSLFPDPQRLIDELKAQGVRLGLILTPFLNRRQRPWQKTLLQALAHNLPPGLEKDDERALPEYAEAQEKGYLAHGDARWWFGAGGMPDFTNPAAAAWWNARMRPLYDQGVDFFKNDDGEYLPEDARSATGMQGGEYHNLYGFYYGKALFEGRAETAERPMIYARSVWAGSQRYPALFLGDQKATFQGMRSALRAGLNLGLLGFAYWTADVFGLDGKTIPETHMRYAQWALLAPVARYFYRPAHIDDTRFPWSHGSQVEDNFRRYTELRYRLLPYYLYLAWQAQRRGLPILRPLILEYQDDPRLAGVDDQAMLGSGLLLCPVLEAGAMARKIRLPAGAWHDFWTEQSWQGPGEIDYPAPLERLPLLVRGGTVLPLGPVMQHIPGEGGSAGAFDPLQFHIWPPYPAEGWLYEDDGYTQAYNEGAYALTHVTVEPGEAGLRLKLAAAQGDFPGLPSQRRVELVLHRQPAPHRVRVDGVETTEWLYQNGELTIPLVCPTRRDVVVEVA
ncbi:MAG: TIM-barrel domain-containing protein [Chloroflexota bacterium]